MAAATALCFLLGGGAVLAAGKISGSIVSIRANGDYWGSPVAKSFLTKPPVISTISSAEQNITVLSHPIGNDGQRQIRWGSNPLRVCRRNFEGSLLHRPLFT